MAIYFDNSATTRPFDFVAQRMQTYMTHSYYNPSALYAPAVEVAQNLRKVRRDFARDLSVHEEEIYFTSGGTESNNTVILGTVLARRGPLHLITTAVEHSSVYEAFLRLEKMGHQVDFLPTDAKGCVRMEDLRRVLRPHTALVSIMHVNNESGAINDIAALAAMVKQVAPRCIFHSDGVQAYLKVPFHSPHVDAYSISAHKFHAPRGVGVLMCKKNGAHRSHHHGRPAGGRDARRHGKRHVHRGHGRGAAILSGASEGAHRTHPGRQTAPDGGAVGAARRAL